MEVRVVKVERARWWRAVLVAAGLLFGCLVQPSSSRGGWDNPVPAEVAPAGLFPPCFEDERAALLGIKAELPNDVLHGWSLDPDVCPCHYWKGVRCGSDENYHVTHLDLANRGLSGTLSPRIGDLISLQKLLLQGNAISGPIPGTIGKLAQLMELDVSNNSLNGSIPSSLGDLKNLSQMYQPVLSKLNNNSLSGPVPDSFGALEATIDLSFNNLSGPLPSNISSGTLDITGNPLIDGVDSGDTRAHIGLICGDDSGDTCSHNQNSKAWPHHGTPISRRVSTLCAVAVSSMIMVVGILL